MKKAKGPKHGFVEVFRQCGIIFFHFIISTILKIHSFKTKI
jgi:hypothetical protein